MANQKESHVQVTVRIPADLHAQMLAYAAKLAAVQVGAPSRNDLVVSLLERGLRDASRPRK